MAPVRQGNGPVTQVCLGLGSNLGDRQANLEAALVRLAGHIELLAVSAIYETEPWGYPYQSHYLNCACLASTSLSPPVLLGLTQEVERAGGRAPTFRNGPRAIDVDILLYGLWRWRTPSLEIPHPRLAQRAFALVPLAEVAPEAVHPVLNETVAAMAARVEGRGALRPWAPPFALDSLAGRL